VTTLPTPPKKIRMTPRPIRKPKPAALVPVAPAPPAVVLAAAPRADWELLSEAIARMIRRQTDETERYHLRVAFLRARYTPWRSQ
jgi:hypothetical protein